MEKTLHLILEKLNSMDNEIKSINSRLSNLEKGQANLEKGQANLEKRQANLEKRQANLEAGQSRIEKKLDAVYEQTAELTEFRTETNMKLDNISDKLNAVEAVTKENLYDIAKLKLIK